MFYKIIVLLAIFAAVTSCQPKAVSERNVSPAKPEAAGRDGSAQKPANGNKRSPSLKHREAPPGSMSAKWKPGIIDTAAHAEYLSPTERKVVLEINMVRTDPAEYARRFLIPLRSFYHKKRLQYPGEIAIATKEGSSALEECIKVLKSAKPVPPLSPKKGLFRAAYDHVLQQGNSGALGHDGSDGSSPETRISRYGKWGTLMGENIDYGNADARRIVTSLLIDDGVPSRGHRHNLLKPAFKVVGIAVGKHPKYSYMCVMDFAASFN
jgi:uncharacterized protein YkwD